MKWLVLLLVVLLVGCQAQSYKLTFDGTKETPPEEVVEETNNNCEVVEVFTPGGYIPCGGDKYERTL